MTLTVIIGAFTFGLIFAIVMGAYWAFVLRPEDQAGSTLMGRFRATGIRPRCCELLASAGTVLPASIFEHQERVG